MALEVTVRPPWPFRLPRRGTGDGTTRSKNGILTRLLHVNDTPIVVRTYQRRDGEVVFHAAPPAGGGKRSDLELAIERMRFALGVDEDLRPFYDRFRADPVLGPAIRRRPWLRTRKRPWPWEALAWAITAQLIESERAAEIQRRIVRRWGPSSPAVPLRDVPSASALAGCAPAELAACDLAPKRATAMIRCAREVAAARVDLDDPGDDHRLRAIPEIGRWTIECLGLGGRGDPDSLPVGDLAYVKLVGRLAGLGRRATLPEIEEFYAPYEPYRGWAGYFTILHYHAGVPAGPPLRLAA